MAARLQATESGALAVHLRYPGRLRGRLRSTNLLERSLEEVGLRTKMIGRFPGETSCPSLCWAVLDCTITSAHALGLAELDGRALSRLKDPRPRIPHGDP